MAAVIHTTKKSRRKLWQQLFTQQRKTVASYGSSYSHNKEKPTEVMVALNHITM